MSPTLCRVQSGAAYHYSRGKDVRSAIVVHVHDSRRFAQAGIKGVDAKRDRSGGGSRAAHLGGQHERQHCVTKHGRPAFLLTRSDGDWAF